MIAHSPSLIEHYTRLGVWQNETLLDKIIANSNRYPNRIAVIDPPNRQELVGSPAGELDYAALADAVDRVAAQLLIQGLKPGEIVFAQLPNVLELLVLYYAVSRAGGVLSAVPVQWRLHELVMVRKQTGARILFTTVFRGFDHLALGRKAGFQYIYSLDLLTTWMQQPPPEVVFPEINANATFSLCWTSGTEAEPKGCPLTHNNWRYQAGLVIEGCRIESGERILCVAPLVNMTAIGVNFVPALLTAGTLLLHHPIDIPLLMHQLSKDRIGFTILVPAVLNLIAKQSESAGLDLSSVRTIVTGSAPPSAWAMREFRRRWDIEVVCVWGQNEGTGLLAGAGDFPDLEARSHQFPFWGGPGCRFSQDLTGIESRLDDASGKEVTQIGGIGELVIRGPNLFPGYFRRPDLDSRSFTADGFFRTGDLFRRVDECRLAFHDRSKDIILRGGFNISSAEIETTVLAHPAVADAAAVPVPDPILGERVGVFVVLREAEATLDLDQLRRFLTERGFAHNKLPEHLWIIASIPRNPLGKIIKAKLRESIPIYKPGT